MVLDAISTDTWRVLAHVVPEKRCLPIVHLQRCKYEVMHMVRVGCLSGNG